MSNEYPKRVRTTFQPDVELEVGEAEYVDLERQGLLVQDAKTKAAPKGAEKQEG